MNTPEETAIAQFEAALRDYAARTIGTPPTAEQMQRALDAMAPGAFRVEDGDASTFLVTVLTPPHETVNVTFEAPPGSRNYGAWLAACKTMARKDNAIPWSLAKCAFDAGVTPPEFTNFQIEARRNVAFDPEMGEPVGGGWIARVSFGGGRSYASRRVAGSMDAAFAELVADIIAEWNHPKLADFVVAAIAHYRG